jgi:hypothetical protein
MAGAPFPVVENWPKLTYSPVPIDPFFDATTPSRTDETDMRSKLDIWRTASATVAEHGNNAKLVASLRADSLLAQYDVDGHLQWKRIKNAIRELQRDKPRRGEWLN